MNLITIFFMLFIVLVYVDSEPITKTMYTPPSRTETATTITTITSTTTTSTNTTKIQKLNNYISPIITWIFVGIMVLILIICVEYVLLSNNIYTWEKHPITVIILLIIASPFIFILQVLYFIIIKPIKYFIKNKINNQIQLDIEIHDNTIIGPQDNEDNEDNEDSEYREDNEDNVLHYSIIDVEITEL